mmetsp:Transcript_46260/g.107579  ORF Transcript_46260/g.107579 Transcript_46260/m.107579 type:complete len:288 (-) Transcript_46260:458-1321(-)
MRVSWVASSIICVASSLEPRRFCFPSAASATSAKAGDAGEPPCDCTGVLCNEGNFSPEKSCVASLLWDLDRLVDEEFASSSGTGGGSSRVGCSIEVHTVASFDGLSELLPVVLFRPFLLATKLWVQALSSSSMPTLMAKTSASASSQPASSARRLRTSHSSTFRSSRCCVPSSIENVLEHLNVSMACRSLHATLPDRLSISHLGARITLAAMEAACWTSRRHLQSDSSCRITCANSSSSGAREMTEQVFKCTTLRTLRRFLLASASRVSLFMAVSCRGGGTGTVAVN